MDDARKHWDDCYESLLALKFEFERRWRESGGRGLQSPLARGAPRIVDDRPSDRHGMQIHRVTACGPGPQIL
jgi:hypothetical protein